MAYKTIYPLMLGQAPKKESLLSAVSPIALIIVGVTAYWWYVETSPSGKRRRRR